MNLPQLDGCTRIFLQSQAQCDSVCRRDSFSKMNNCTRNISEGALEPFWFEKLDRNWAMPWVASYRKIMIWVSVAYILAAFTGREFMRNRKPFELKRPLIIWNTILAIFSTVCFLRTLPSLLYLLRQEDGMYRSVCTEGFVGDADHFWAFAYTLSKPLEFIDTVFIILRKAPLLFLHYYHHMSMAIFMFTIFPISDPINRWGGIINSGVHSIMYTYYALKVAGVKIPRKWSSKITTIQLGQFIITLLVNIYASLMALRRPCTLSSTTFIIQIIGCVTYGGLFSNYFYQTYVRRKPKKA